MAFERRRRDADVCREDRKARLRGSGFIYERLSRIKVLRHLQPSRQPFGRLGRRAASRQQLEGDGLRG